LQGNALLLIDGGSTEGREKPSRRGKKVREKKKSEGEENCKKTNGENHFKRKASALCRGGL